MRLIIGGYDFTRCAVIGTNSIKEADFPRETWTDGNGRTHRVGIIKKAVGSIDLLLRTQNDVDNFKELMCNGINSGGYVSVTTKMVNTGQEKTFDAFIDADPVENVINERLSIEQFTLTIEEA